jgi:hypothetical protein
METKSLIAPVSYRLSKNLKGKSCGRGPLSTAKFATPSDVTSWVRCIMFNEFAWFSNVLIRETVK